MGLVYIIHFEEKLKHAQHYIGFVENDLQQRIERHLANQGSKLLAAVNKAGIKWEVVKVYENVDRAFERKLKNRKGARHLCPKCCLKSV